VSLVVLLLVSPLLLLLVLLHAFAATALAAVSPSSTATAARGMAPSSRRSVRPQVGQRVSDDLAWQAQLGHTINAGGMAR
jgi:hypothetical protein